MKLVQCCDEPRGFVGGVCDHCGGEVQSEFTNLELQQQVSEWRSKAYEFEVSYRLATKRISELRDRLAKQLTILQEHGLAEYGN